MVECYKRLRRDSNDKEQNKGGIERYQETARRH
jgi:hypothetical protein